LFCFAKVQNILHHTSSASLPIQESGGTFPRWGRLINSRLSYEFYLSQKKEKLLVDKQIAPCYNKINRSTFL